MRLLTAVIVTRSRLAQATIEANIEEGSSLGVVQLDEFCALLMVILDLDLVRNDGLDQADLGAESKTINICLRNTLC